jgi:Molecular chaperone, HSP90 family
LENDDPIRFIPNHEVSLRELIANASDACDRLRYMQQTDEELQKLGQNFQVDIVLDKDAGTITITDNYKRHE